MAKTRINYVDNKKFYEAIVEHKKKSKENTALGLAAPQLSNYIGDCISKIAHNFSNSPKFIRYSFREEMVSDAIENCIQYFDSFDPDRFNNPFAYFSQISYNAFIRKINKEEKERYTKYKYFQETILHTDQVDDLVDDDNNHLIPTMMYDNINEFMKAFEEKEEKKKQKRKELKQLQKYAAMENIDGE